jgi:hypothetical protein
MTAGHSVVRLSLGSADVECMVWRKAWLLSLMVFLLCVCARCCEEHAHQGGLPASSAKLGEPKEPDLDVERSCGRQALMWLWDDAAHG